MSVTDDASNADGEGEQVEAGDEGDEQGDDVFVFRVGERIRAKYLASQPDQNGEQPAMWYSGVVTRVNPDGTVDVNYDDGDQESGVKPEYVERGDGVQDADGEGEDAGEQSEGDDDDDDSKAAATGASEDKATGASEDKATGAATGAATGSASDDDDDEESAATGSSLPTEADLDSLEMKLLKAAADNEKADIVKRIQKMREKLKKK